MIYTTGYQNLRTLAELIEQLKMHRVELLLDVRSKPYSRNAAFRKETIERNFVESGIFYRWMGRSLGGFSEISESAIKNLVELQKDKRVCLMCMEADLDKCHRKREIARRLEAYGVMVTHLEL